MHPQLRVRRDVAGVLREVIGPVTDDGQQPADPDRQAAANGHQAAGDGQRADGGDRPADGGQPGGALADARESSYDELTESWTHIEIPTLADGEAKTVAADLRRVLGDVRVAVEDYPRMRARALALADDVLAPEGEATAAPTPRLRSPSCCAGWRTRTSRSSAFASTTWRPAPTAWR